MILIHNKCDIQINYEESESQFKEFWKKNGFIGGFRTSAKSSINVNESMEFLISDIIEKLEKFMGTGEKIKEKSDAKKNNIVISSKSEKTEKNKNCC